MSIQHDVSISRHLLRALLRECTYLPDPASQLFVRDQVLRRFRDYHINWQKEPDSASERVRRDLVISRIPSKQAEARKTLSILSRANVGESSAIFKTLLYTYGRTGKRRHDLIEPLLKPDVPPDADLPENKQDAPSSWLPEWEQLLWPDIVGRPKRESGGKNNRYRISRRYQKLRALVESQTSHAPIETSRSRLRGSSFVTPVFNAWARPMPRKRERNRVTAWYGSVLERLLPPLPPPEWDRLKELATGARKWQGLKAKRKAIGTKLDRLGFKELEMLTRHDGPTGGLDYLRSECRQAGVSDLGGKDEMLERLANAKCSRYQEWDLWLASPDATQEAFDDVLSDAAGLITLQKRKVGIDTITGSHKRQNITARVMQRLWRKIFTQCPKMDWDVERNRWFITWGTIESPVRSATPSCGEAALFDGVDEEGKAQEWDPNEELKSRKDIPPLTTDNWNRPYPLILEPWPPDRGHNKEPISAD